MSHTIVYLHGVGGVTPLEDWLDPLNVGLAQAGHSPVDPAYDTVVPVTYQSLLLAPPQGRTSRGDDSRPTWEAPDDDGEAARDYALTQEDTGAFVRRLTHRSRGVHFGHTPLRLSGHVSNVVARVGDLTEAKVYASHRAVRAEVVRDVLSQLPHEGSVVLVAHSLGSVIAADLLTRLPPGLRVSALLTLGSPLASEMWRHTRPLAADFPYDRVGAWVNVFDPRDAITFGRGISGRFPMAVDLAVDIRSHSVRGYAAHPAVGAVLGHLLYGEPATAGERPPARALAPGWHLHLLGHAYAEQLSRTCSPKKFSWRRRFDTARRIAATRLVEEAEHDLDLGSAPSPDDLLDRASDLVRDVWSDGDLVPLAVQCHLAAPVQPFDLAVAPAHRRAALEALLDRVRRRQGSISDSEFAAAVTAAVDAASDALSPERRRWRAGSGVVEAVSGGALWSTLPAGLTDPSRGLVATTAGAGGVVAGMLGLQVATGVGSPPVRVVEQDEEAAAEQLRAAVADALARLGSADLRGLLVALLAVVRTQEMLGLPSSRPHVEEILVAAQSHLAQEAHLQAVLAPKRPGSREVAERAELVVRAVDQLLAPAESGEPVEAG
ncbi:hypothetical protein IEQ44_03515 [Nocardioides sp. Y6]|uniref:Alpha/beta hydrolase n=1 Tax=Nocardioides malaquae TaxID=2773426 RepID=A0ABR9RQD0_9ACTN|nr:hypothetical protein [Nocardioides malaquae]MBE7323718.1 hypothetical protein [Nocardioides malaquae]